MDSGLFKNRRGFTLTEILIVVIIIGILVAIAIPMFINVAKSAEHAALKYNGTYVVKVLALNIRAYDAEDRYAPPNPGEFNYTENSLNNLLEKELEYYQANSNKDRITNPKSGSQKILHGDNPVSGSIDDGRNPAVFITGNAAYSWSGSSVDDLTGTIVTYINQSLPYNVQVYYIGRDGVKSEKLVDFN